MFSFFIDVFLKNKTSLHMSDMLYGVLMLSLRRATCLRASARKLYKKKNRLHDMLYLSCQTCVTSAPFFLRS
jgi:hypothetical protein